MILSWIQEHLFLKPLLTQFLFLALAWGFPFPTTNCGCCGPAPTGTPEPSCCPGAGVRLPDTVTVTISGTSPTCSCLEGYTYTMGRTTAPASPSTCSHYSNNPTPGSPPFPADPCASGTAGSNIGFQTRWDMTCTPSDTFTILWIDTVLFTTCESQTVSAASASFSPLNVVFNASLHTWGCLGVGKGQPCSTGTLYTYTVTA